MATFPKGIRIFSPKPTAPPFIKGQIIITPKELFEWLKAEPDVLTDYKDTKQLKLTIMEKKDGTGLNVVVDTYKPKDNGLPF